MDVIYKQLEHNHPNEKVDAHNVDNENEHQPDMLIPVPEGEMPSRAHYTPGRVEHENDYELNDLASTAIDIDQIMEQD